MARSGRSDQASVVAKQSVTREQFVKTTETDRAKLGKMSSRKVAGITRSISKGGKLPAGMYVNVNFATRFGNDAQAMPRPVISPIASPSKPASRANARPRSA